MTINEEIFNILSKITRDIFLRRIQIWEWKVRLHDKMARIVQRKQTLFIPTPKTFQDYRKFSCVKIAAIFIDTILIKITFDI